MENRDDIQYAEWFYLQEEIKVKADADRLKILIYSFNELTKE